MHVIPGSTPVVAFGDACTARVATLGLNPSGIEFVDKKEGFLEGGKRRLATHNSLGLSDLTIAPLHIISRVLEDCNCYFQRQPYRRWFDQLEQILNMCGASYYDGTACHLDLVQWATEPVWGQLPPDVRARLIKDDAAFLASQLRNENICLLLVNGAGVWKQLQVAYREELVIEHSDIIDGLSYRSTSLSSGTLFGTILVVAWSTNLQSAFGVTKELRKELARRVAAIHTRFVASDGAA